MARVADISEVLLRLGLSASVTDEERSAVDSALTEAEGAVRRFLGHDPVHAERTEYHPQQNFALNRPPSVWEVDGGQAVLRQLVESSTSELPLRHIPVRSIADLRIDHDGRSGARAGAFGVETLKTEGVDYWPNYDMLDSSGNKVCRDGILRSSGGWPTAPGTISVKYTAGYTQEELHGQDEVLDASPILQAVVEEACCRVRRALAVHAKKTGAGFAGPFKSEKLGDYAYTADDHGTGELLGLSDLLPRTVDALADYRNLAYVIGG